MCMCAPTYMAVIYSYVHVTYTHTYRHKYTRSWA